MEAGRARAQDRYHRDHQPGPPSRRLQFRAGVPAKPAVVAGPEGISLLDATECWIYQHGLRHRGEIELARGLVGLEGMTS